jgi:hypothetical protein
MFNDNFNARKSARELEQAIYRGPIKNSASAPIEVVHLSYNQNESALTQLYQVREQKDEDSSREFWLRLSRMSLAPEWFQKKALEISLEWDEQRYVFDIDLKRHVETYKKVLVNDGDRVILVAHSQGNFYGNSAFALLGKEIKELSGHFQMISVATPANSVAGNGSYTSLASDGVINFIRRSKGALAANISNAPAGRWDHEFVRHYLKGNRSGEKILGDYKRQHAMLDQSSNEEPNFSFPPDLADSQYLDRSLEPIRRWAVNFRERRGPLKDHECLALAALAQNYNLWGASCEKRSLKESVKWLSHCATGWSKGKGPELLGFDDCYVHELETGLSPYTSGKRVLDDLLSKNTECRWNMKTLRTTLGGDTLDRAKAFLQAPTGLVSHAQ